MRQLSSTRCTGHFGIFTLTSRRCLAAGETRRALSGALSPGPVWYSLREPAPTLRTCRPRRLRPGSARGMQRFLTESHLKASSDERDYPADGCREYLGTRLEHPEGVWVLDGTATTTSRPPAGEASSAGAWPGSTAGGCKGRWTNSGHPAGMFGLCPRYVSPCPWDAWHGHLPQPPGRAKGLKSPARELQDLGQCSRPIITSPV